MPEGLSRLSCSCIRGALSKDAYPDVKHPFSEDFKGDCATETFLKEF